MKLCIIYNFAQKYREAVFKKMDEKWDCKWYFGTNNTDIKGFNLSSLKRAQQINNSSFLGGKVSFQSGIVPLLFKDDFDVYILLGELFCVSTWFFLLMNKVYPTNKRVYLWSHGWYGRETWLKKILKKLFFGMADGTFLYGNYAKSIAITQGNKGSKLHVLHNSLDYDFQKQLREKLIKSDIYKNHFGNSYPNLFFIGRLSSVKRLDLLICAVSKLIKDKFKVNLTFIGDGEERQSLEKLVLKYGLEEYVWFYGECYDDNKNAELIYNADLCVAPGNVGLTAMHTMAFGTPVLTHDNFPMQMPEFEAIKRGITGDFFKYGDVDDMADKIKTWILNKSESRENIRKNCIQEIESSWNPDFQIGVIANTIES